MIFDSFRLTDFDQSLIASSLSITIQSLSSGNPVSKYYQGQVSGSKTYLCRILRLIFNLLLPNQSLWSFTYKFLMDDDTVYRYFQCLITSEESSKVQSSCRWESNHANFLLIQFLLIKFNYFKHTIIVDDSIKIKYFEGLPSLEIKYKG